jgi:hypothetical protein
MVSMPSYCMALLAATLIALTGAFVPTTTLRPQPTALAAKRRLADIKSSKISRKKKPPKAATAAEATSKALELGLKVMDKFQRPEFFAEAGMLFERLGELVNATTAAPSPIAGTGLFAARDLPAGTIVALYPAHAIGRGEQCMSYDTDTDYFKKQMSSGPARDSCPYRQNVLGDRSLFGVANDQIEDPFYIDANPEQPLVDGWTAHLVNDAVMCDAGDEESVVRYYEASLARRNCLIVPVGPAPLMGYATTRDVEAGEELLTTYGAEYWVEVKATPLIADISRKTYRNFEKIAELTASGYATDFVQLEMAMKAMGDAVSITR